MKSLTIQAFDLDKDIKADVAVAKARKHIANEKGACIFDPKGYDGNL